MSGTARVLLLLVLTCALATSAEGQASPFVPLDDPMLPQVEHLILRGDLADPSPMVRPFRRSDIRKSLAAADTSIAAVRALAAWYAEPLLSPIADTAAAVRFRVGARGGFQAGTQARRDFFHPAGAGTIWGYAEVRAEAQWGPLTIVSRPGFENRVRRDPDWPGRRDNFFSGRLFEGYASLQSGPARLSYGQFERNWGPAGLPGFSISNVTYRRDGWAFELMTRRLQFSAYASQLADERDSTGALAKRYFLTKRLGVQITDRLNIAAWEATVLTGEDRSFEAAFSNPFSFAYATLTYGYGDVGTNNMLGADITWRVLGRNTLHAQLALDDLWIQDRERNRDRFGGTVRVSGPLGRRVSYSTTYSLVSSLALRAFRPTESVLDGGVGIGRNFSDNDQFTVQLGVPVRGTWLLTPEVTLFRQGEGSPRAPYPALPADPVLFPTLFIGTVERTYRLAMGVAGRTGALQVLGNVGLHRVENSGNQAGVRVNRVEARVQATIGTSAAGWLR